MPLFAFGDDDERGDDATSVAPASSVGILDVVIEVALLRLLSNSDFLFLLRFLEPSMPEVAKFNSTKYSRNRQMFLVWSDYTYYLGMSFSTKSRNYYESKLRGRNEQASLLYYMPLEYTYCVS